MSEADEIARQLRTHLGTTPPEFLPPEVIRPLLARLTTLPDRTSIIVRLEELLQNIYHTDVDHSTPDHACIMVAFLHQIRKQLPATSIISTWFDLLLRPVMREPRTRKDTVDQVIDLVVGALVDNRASNSKREGFAKRLLELYLLDAPSLSSGEEALEKVSLDRDERRRRKFWKNNLESTLLAFAIKNPALFFTQVDIAFAVPTSRLQLLLLFSLLVQQQNLPITELLKSSFLQSLMLSLQVDNSTTVFSVGITAVSMLLPNMAIKTKGLLPVLFSILGRAICWRMRPKLEDGQDDGGDGHIVEHDVGPWSKIVMEERVELFSASNTREAQFHVRDELGWERLDSAFDLTVAAPPDASRLFLVLYGLWPCNTVAFTRDPVGYLTSKTLECPYAEGWDEVFDRGYLQSRAAVLLRRCMFHPAIISTNAAEELHSTPPWAEMDTTAIVSMCSLLDVRNLALRNRDINDPPSGPQRSQSISTSLPLAVESHPRPQISIQDMIATHILLKSGADVDIVDDIAFTSATLLPSITSTHDVANQPSEPVPEARRAEQAISILQREVLLLMNELNFELFLRQKYLAHVTRLHNDRMDIRREETEMQSLQNKLREYRVRFEQATDKLERNTREMSQREVRHTEYAQDLKAKEKLLREEKKAWTSQAIILRAEMDQTKSMFAAQSRLLADSQERVFTLETQIKEISPKVQRIADYEQRLGQLQKAQALWDQDVERYKEQDAQIAVVKSNWKKMESFLASHAATNHELEDINRSQRQRIQQLEKGTDEAAVLSIPKLTLTQEYLDGASQTAHRLADLEQEYSKLRQANHMLSEEVEELLAMVEALKTDSIQRGRRGSQAGQSPALARGSFRRDGSGSAASRVFPGTSPMLSPVALADLANASEEGLIEPLE